MFTVEWATHCNRLLKYCGGTYLSEHSIKCHVRLDKHKGKSKFSRYYSDGQTLQDFVDAIDQRLAQWTALAMCPGHPPNYVQPAHTVHHVIITIQRPDETGTRTLRTPEGTQVFPQTSYDLMVHERDGTVKNAHPSEGGYTHDGNFRLYKSEYFALWFIHAWGGGGGGYVYSKRKFCSNVKVFIIQMDSLHELMHKYNLCTNVICYFQTQRGDTKFTPTYLGPRTMLMKTEECGSEQRAWFDKEEQILKER